MPKFYIISPRIFSDSQLSHFSDLFGIGNFCVQWRAKHQTHQYVSQHIGDYLHRCQRFQALLFVNHLSAFELNVLGLNYHLSLQATKNVEPYTSFPKAKISMACHSLEHLKYADQMKMDMALLSPIQATKTHLNVPILGWEKARSWIAQTCTPTYCLGGMKIQHAEQVKRVGAQGIAGIQCFETINTP